jgi:YgiT-type zinc finger domain-containing protein
MNCFYCKGTLKEHTINDYNDLGSCIIIVRGVPCQKCTQCDEIIFDFSTGERIEEIVDTLKDSLTREVAVAQYSETEINFVKYVEAAVA